MRCCGEANEGRRKSKVVDEQIRADRRKLDEELKLLLLGAGESGKSTFAKQMRILHMNGFDDVERRSFRVVIHRNILESMEAILKACTEFGINIQPANEKYAIKFSSRAYEHLNEEAVEEIKILWRDAALQEAIHRASQFQYFDSTPYFIEHLDRIGSDAYMPTNEDILHSRSQTCGVVETQFTVKDVPFRMCDVAGQRSERRKWMHCFGDVKAVLIIVGISEYDQYLREQSDVNRMHEALKLFGDICNSRWFEKTTIILFLNKMDLFAAKLRKVPLTTCFPNYTGPNSFEECTRYISEQFLAVNKNPRKLIYTHLTCATDTSNISHIFNAVRETILEEMLANFS